MIVEGRVFSPITIDVTIDGISNPVGTFHVYITEYCNYIENYSYLAITNVTCEWYNSAYNRHTYNLLGSSIVIDNALLAMLREVGNNGDVSASKPYPIISQNILHDEDGTGSAEVTIGSFKISSEDGSMTFNCEGVTKILTLTKLYARCNPEMFMYGVAVGLGLNGGCH